MPARMAGLFVAIASTAGAGFAGCGFETGGLSTATSGGSGGSTTSHGVGTGGGDAGAGGREDGGGNDASIDVGPVDAAPLDAEPLDAAPLDAGPTAYASCKDWLAAQPGAASGVYDLLDLMGNVYEAYCEMGGDGGVDGDGGPAGGWTLALKIDGNQATFPYGAALWTNATAYNADKPELDTNEAKLASFWSVPVTELRVGMTDGGVTRWLVVPLAAPAGFPVPLLDLVSLGANPPQTTLGRAAWEGLLVKGSIQTHCNWEGINADGKVRIGMVGDDSGDCGSPDSFIGFGADGSFQSPSFDCGNIAHYSPDNGDQTTPTFGYVMVR